MGASSIKAIRRQNCLVRNKCDSNSEAALVLKWWSNWNSRSSRLCVQRKIPARFRYQQSSWWQVSRRNIPSEVHRSVRSWRKSGSSASRLVPCHTGRTGRSSIPPISWHADLPRAPFLLIHPGLRVVWKMFSMYDINKARWIWFDNIFTADIVFNFQDNYVYARLPTAAKRRYK